MPSLLADHNCGGHVERIRELMAREGLGDFWAEMTWDTAAFADFGLHQQSADEEIWRVCQDNDLVLITINRNDDRPDSLESTIRNFGKSTSLPVITLADGDRFLFERDYATRTVYQLVDYLLRIDDLRGTGRLYVP